MQAEARTLNIAFSTVFSPLGSSALFPKLFRTREGLSIRWGTILDPPLIEWSAEVAGDSIERQLVEQQLSHDEKENQ